MKIFFLLFIPFLLFHSKMLAQDEWFNQISGTNQNLTDVCFVSEETGWVVGLNGAVLQTTNRGDEWISKYINDGYDYQSVLFINPLIGFIIGNEINGSGNIILNTTDAGQTWNSIIDLSHRKLVDVFFINTHTGWVIGRGNEGIGQFMHKTTDGGQTWFAQADTSFGYFSIFFIDENTGWVTANEYFGCRIYKTTDGGNNWVGLNNGGIKLGFMDNQTGCVTGGLVEEGGAIWGSMHKTNDGGNNWYEVYSASAPISLFIRGTICWSTTIYKPCRGPATYQIIKSINGGDDWDLQFTNNQKLISIYFANDNLGWVVGNGGTILHTTNGGVSFVEEEQTDDVPTEFNLSNNFPNPFNPSTKIRYSVPQSSNVVIKVFDVLGNEIETLVNEEKTVGTYEIIYYAEKLPSGVYYYQIQTVAFVETKKMLLVK